ncbi:MAG: zinc ABC transporter substrate-binding protein [Elusimicrobia bacterium]|nr:zinc ABC transporter substrate-binding protein [Elusimicrobiota bacterium]
MNKKIAFITIFLVVVILSLLIISNLSRKPDIETKKIKVVTTLFPLYDFARNIGQDKLDISLLLPPGVEAHSFEPKPSDIIRISKSGVFIYTGKFMEPWAEDVIKGSIDKNVKVVDSSKGTRMIQAVSRDKDKKKGSLDPHIWLDFDDAKIMVDNITQALCEKDPGNKEFYKQQSRKYKDTLSKLDNEYKKSLASCKNKEIIYCGHYAFGYLANRYGLKYLSAQGVSPDAEPTVQDLIKLINQIRKDKIEYVFYEELTSPKIAETITNETKAKMLFLNAAHNISKEQFNNNISFVSIMENNLKNLKTGLKYQD